MNNIGKLSYDSGITKQSFTWTIENFQYYLSKSLNTYVLSPAFSTLHNNNEKLWRIRFQPRNSAKELQDCSSIFLQYFGESEVVVSVKFCTIRSDLRFDEKYLERQLFRPQNSLYGFNDFIKHTNVAFRSDKLTICCEISFDQKALTIPTILYDTANKKTDSGETNSLGADFQDDLNKLFETGLLSDVTIAIGEKKISLHKAILASRSEVFRAMFQHDMVEKEKSVVNIVDIRLEVAIEMFRYMYTGRVNDIEKLSVDELLIAAEKYTISGLKITCENKLCTSLNFDNALKYLMLASTHNSIHLKKKVIDFIAMYLNNFVDKPEFKLLDQNILCELFSAVAKRNTY